MRSGREATVFNEINITPLTDIFLVLLIIMMVVAPLLEYRQIDLAVPSNNDVSVPDEQHDAKLVRVVIDAADAYTLDGHTVASANLATEIRTAAQTRPDGLVIETDPNATFGAMAHAMDAAQQAGVVHVMTMETPPPSAPAAATARPSPAPKSHRRRHRGHRRR